MKYLATLLFVAIALVSSAQSKSYLTLRDKFKGGEDVTSVKVGGFVLKTALWIAGESEWKDDFGEIKSVRVINIPQKEFTEQGLTANGFKKKVLAKDDFEEVASTYDHGERLTIYLKDKTDKDALYFLLVESKSEVTAVEIRGQLYPKKIIADHQKNNWHNAYAIHLICTLHRSF